MAFNQRKWETTLRTAKGFAARADALEAAALRTTETGISHVVGYDETRQVHRWVARPAGESLDKWMARTALDVRAEIEGRD